MLYGCFLLSSSVSQFVCGWSSLFSFVTSSMQSTCRVGRSSAGSSKYLSIVPFNTKAAFSVDRRFCSLVGSHLLPVKSSLGNPRCPLWSRRWMICVSSLRPVIQIFYMTFAKVSHRRTRYQRRSSVHCWKNVVGESWNELHLQFRVERKQPIYVQKKGKQKEQANKTPGDFFNFLKQPSVTAGAQGCPRKPQEDIHLSTDSLVRTLSWTTVTERQEK